LPGDAGDFHELIHKKFTFFLRNGYSEQRFDVFFLSLCPFNHTPSGEMVFVRTIGCARAGETAFAAGSARFAGASRNHAGAGPARQGRHAACDSRAIGATAPWLLERA
jgi:hypothetical protein